MLSLYYTPPKLLHMKSPLANTILQGDCLSVLQGFEAESADLIYLDPPFNKGRAFVNENKGYGFNDSWRAGTKVEQATEHTEFLKLNYPKIVALLELAESLDGTSAKHYLTYMAIRLIPLHNILKNTGSIYYHIDNTMGAWVKLLLDSVFGTSHFRNAIIWQRHSANNNSNKRCGRIYDTIYLYAKGKEAYWTDPRNPYKDDHFPHKDARGRYCTVGLSKPDRKSEPWKGYDPASIGKGCGWKIPRNIIYPLVGEKRAKEMNNIQKLVALEEAGYIHWPKSGGFPRYKQYEGSAGNGSRLQDLWTDCYEAYSRHTKGIDYPTMKPPSLLKRIITASSKENDLILDPFCGSGTTCLAAKLLNRRWIGIDASPEAVKISHNRLSQVQQPLF